MSSNSRHHRTQPRWSRPRLALALTAISVSLYGLSAWQISRDPDVTNINLLVFVLAQPTCALLSALTLLGPAQRRFAKTLYRPLAALTAKLMRIHVLLQLLVALVALQNLGATASAKRRRRRQQQHVQNAHAHAHDSDVGSLYAQTQFYALFAAQIAVPIAAALALQYIVARELGLFVATAEQNELLAKSSSISAGLAPLSASAHNEAVKADLAASTAVSSRQDAAIELGARTAGALPQAAAIPTHVINPSHHHHHLLPSPRSMSMSMARDTKSRTWSSVSAHLPSIVTEARSLRDLTLSLGGGSGSGSGSANGNGNGNGSGPILPLLASATSSSALSTSTSPSPVSDGNSNELPFSMRNRYDSHASEHHRQQQQQQQQQQQYLLLQRATARGSHATTLPWSSSSPKAHPRGRRLSHSLFSSPSPSPPSPSTSSSSTSRSPASVSRSRRIEDDLSPSGVRSHRRHHRAHHSVCLPLGLVHLGSAGGAGGTTARAEAPADGLLLTSSAPAPAPTTLTNAVA